MKKTFLPNMRAVLITGPHDAGQNNVIQFLLNKFKPENIEQIESLDEITCANESKILILKTSASDANTFEQKAKHDGANVLLVYIWASKEERANRIKSENPSLNNKTIDLLLKQGTSPDRPKDLPSNKFFEIKNPRKETDEATACAIEREIRKTLISASKQSELELADLKSRKHTSACSMQ